MMFSRSVISQVSCVVKAQKYTGLILLGLIFLPGLSQSAAWQLRPTIVVEERVQDNIKMKPEESSIAHETVFQGVLGFRRFSETSNVEGRAHVDLSTERSSRHFSTINAFKKFTLSTIGLGALYRRENLGIDDSDELDASDEVGNPNSDNVMRNSLKLDPYWQRRLNERTTLDLNFGFENVFYENDSGSNEKYSDFTKQSISPSLVRQLSERDVILATFSVSRYRADNSKNTEGDSYELSLGYKTSFSERTKWGISGGVRHTITDDDTLDEAKSSQGFVMQANMNAKFELTNVNVRVKRNLIPSGSGGWLEVNDLGANMNHKFRPRLFGTFSMRLTQKEIVDGTNYEKRYNFRASPRIGWKMTQWWALSMGYKHIRREIENSTDDAANNILFLQVRYSKGIAI